MTFQLKPASPEEIAQRLEGTKPSPSTVPRQRARVKKGTFAADDPSTPENEAWVEKPAKE